MCGEETLYQRPGESPGASMMPKRRVMGEILMFLSASSCVYKFILNVGRPNFTFVVLKTDLLKLFL